MKKKMLRMERQLLVKILKSNNKYLKISEYQVLIRL